MEKIEKKYIINKLNEPFYSFFCHKNDKDKKFKSDKTIIENKIPNIKIQSNIEK